MLEGLKFHFNRPSPVEHRRMVAAAMLGGLYFAGFCWSGSQPKAWAVDTAVPEASGPAERHANKEDTYTVTSVIQVLKPVNPADMNDDFQDARVLAQDQDSCTVEMTYYPLYRPGGWREPQLAQRRRWDDGVSPPHAKRELGRSDEARSCRGTPPGRHRPGPPDRQTTRRTGLDSGRRTGPIRPTPSAFGRSIIPDGKPAVYPPLRQAFDEEKPDKTWTDQQMFEQEVLGPIHVLQQDSRLLHLVLGLPG